MELNSEKASHFRSILLSYVVKASVLKPALTQILFFTIAIISSLPLFAQEFRTVNGKEFRHFTIKDGLPENSVTAIIQDQYGFMWFGMESGLVRYDGYEFKKFAPELNASGVTLSFNVSTLFEDKDGDVWVGMENSGLYRFDRQSESFKHYTHKAEDDNSLSNQTVNSINQDEDGFIWVGTQKGLNRLNKGANGERGISFTRYFMTDTSKINVQIINESKKPATYIPGNDVFEIFKDSKNTLWFGVQGGLSKLVLEKNEAPLFLNFFHNPDDPHGLSLRQVRSIVEKKDGKLWLFGLGNVWLENDVNVFEPALWKVEYRYENFLRAGRINSVVETKPNKFWIGCKGFGFYEIDFHQDPEIAQTATVNYLLDKKSGTVQLPNQPRNRWHGKTANSTNAIFQDSYGNLWIGTSDNGLLQYSKAGLFRSINFPRSEHNENISTTCVIEDNNGQIWLGTNGAGLYSYSPEKGVFTNYIFDSNKPQQLFGNHIHSLFEDSQSVIWIGNNRGLNHFDAKSGQFNQQLYKIPSIGTTANRYVNTIHEDKNNVFWMGYMNGGLTRYRPDKHAIKFYKANLADSTAISSNWISKLYVDRSGVMWTGFRNKGFDKITVAEERAANNYKAILDEFKITDYLTSENGDLLVNSYQSIAGAFWFDDQKYIGKNRYFKTLPELEVLALEFKNYIPTISVLDFYEDEKGRFWIGTKKSGLLLFDRNSGVARPFATADGLPDNNVTSILPDGHSNLWIVTASGITKFNPDTHQMTTFDGTDGLQMPYKDKRTNFINKDGEFLICGLNGFYLFHPDSIPDNPYPPNVVLTNFKLHNEIVEWGEGAPLKQPIHLCEQLDLSFNQNTFTFEFAALHYENSSRNQFQCLLEGVESNWRELGDKRETTYTDLSPGNYVLKVKACNRDGVWSEKIVSLPITISPPWWATWWAYLLYFMFAALTIYVVYHFQLNRKLAVAEADRLRELDVIKNRLYTNITHEFRTPLTVISGMTESFRDSKKPKHQKAVELIRRNSENLLNLINQMLDLSKMESGNLKLNLEQKDVVSFLLYVTESFQTLGESNDVRLMAYSEIDELVMDFDDEKLKHVVSNLMSNAIKFTGKNGKIVLHVAVVESSDRQAKELQIKVKDNGLGIPADKLPKIFDRFYQVDDSSIRKGEGTGIGLALTKELVKLMGGEITVNSEVGKGTEFKVLMPIKRTAPKPSSKQQSFEPSLEEDSSTATSIALKPLNREPAVDSDKPLLLVIEDNKDVITYIKTCLEDHYQVKMAINGQEGIDKALELIPDIIISDVMMPEKDGYQVCASLKADERTSHIPIILLTAKTTVQDKLTGLRQGADAYLAKPFNREELLIRLEKLILLRGLLRERYSTFGFGDNRKSNTSSPEAAFLSKFHQLIEDNISDESFGIPQVCKGMGMSRSQVYRKLTALTGKSTSLYIRSIRLHKAKDLLKATDLNVSEIAFEIGFTDPLYFSRVFSKEFGYPPSKE